jgi:hypothetical protein
MTGRHWLEIEPRYARPETAVDLLAISERDAPRVMVASRDGRSDRLASRLRACQCNDAFCRKFSARRP